MKRALLALGLLLLPATANANGRFPESNQIFFSPSDDQYLVLRTTFGLLVSHDRGGKWQWVCEQAIPIVNSEDPMVAITPKGNVLATTFTGIVLSGDKGCGWSMLGGPLSNPDSQGNERGRVFIDLAANPSDAKDVVVFASSYDHQDGDGGIFFSSQIFETTDEGATFAKLGPDFDPTLLGQTLDLTKSDPNRIYVTAGRNISTSPTAVLLVSTDHGQTYVERPIPLEGTERAAYIAAVDPTSADKIYVRTSNGTDKPSRLLFSEDAGQQWKVLYTAAGPLYGFALAPDASKVYVGGPKDGIRVASTTDFAFKQTSSIETQCLGLSSDGLWACSNEKSGFIVALSKDDGATFEKKTHFCDIAGALDCPAGTSTNTECVSRWPAQSASLGCSTDGVDGGATTDASSDGSVPEGDAIVEPGGGCNCNMTTTSPFAAFAGTAVAALGLAATIARRRRRGRQTS